MRITNKPRMLSMNQLSFFSNKLKQNTTIINTIKNINEQIVKETIPLLYIKNGELMNKVIDTGNQYLLKCFILSLPFHHSSEWEL
ncbi:hypothetical protein NO1_0188 [Candidatus Termititenax aidoneus]|uniref:Uncharacterized protein n=1 Tax=Termititenax aidoneus TaxID=2218524 RepID=A0A388T7T7_TERA1|nr:hypothetical protein NO1_0188 [Candidatus Termititenax aidoneus]